ncbi:MAG: SsrA-binding protein SmpB [Cellulosilyticaceae bacterium]
MAKNKDGYKLIAQNKKAYHDYFIEEVYEAGIVLVGTEVKSIRGGSGSIKESFVRIKDGEAFIHNMHINPYDKGNIFNKEPLRIRKLLLHKKEINNLVGEISTQGMTIVPLKVYIKGSLVKMEIGLARGKKLHDKRHDIAKKDAQRNMHRALKDRNNES